MGSRSAAGRMAASQGAGPCHPLSVIQPVGPLSVIRPSWAIDCLLDHAYVANCPYQCKPRLPCLRAEDENRRKNRVPSSAAPKKPSNNFNNTPQVPSPSMLPPRSLRQQRHRMESGLLQRSNRSQRRYGAGCAPPANSTPRAASPRLRSTRARSAEFTGAIWLAAARPSRNRRPRELTHRQSPFNRYRLVLTIQEKVLGPEYPDTATSLNNLADLLRAQGDLAGARPLYERALAELVLTRVAQ